MYDKILEDIKTQYYQQQYSNRFTTFNAVDK
jgi:hypothetical protein